MMNTLTVQKKFIVAALLLMFTLAVSSAMAMPPSQIPCFGGEGCPEPVNPEPDEYYTIQCTTNTIWVWRTTPNPPIPVAGISLLQVNALSDGGSLIATGIPTGNVTLTRSGDTITVSGENGNLAPQPGEKSFTWSECLILNGGLPELPFDLETLTDEQRACLGMTDEQERVNCLNALVPPTPTPNPQTCDDPIYLQMNLEECTFVSCPSDPDIRVADLSDCPDAVHLFIQFINDLIEYYCGISVQAGVVIFAFVAFTTRRKRK